MEQKRYAGILLAAAGVAAAFVVTIETGYRVTRTPGSPISDVLYFTSIVALALLIAMAVRSWWLPGTGTADFTRPPEAHDAEPRRPAETPTDRFSDVRRHVQSLAQVIDAPDDLLPTFGRSEQNGRPHIEIDGESYHYVLAERGQEYERYSTSSLDDLMYRVLRDIAFSMSASLARPQRKPGEDFRREMFKQQVMLLDRLKPEWAARCEAEHREVLASHPFVDER